MAVQTRVTSSSPLGAPRVDRSTAPAGADSLIEALERLQREFDALRVREEAQLAALRRLEEQIEHAAVIQRNLRPARLPDVAGLEISVFYRSAETLGGDAYDTVRLDADRAGFMLSDATGHGIPAALLSSYVQRGLRGAGATEPDEVLGDVNVDLLERALSDGQFVAALYAVYDQRSGVLRWARGGAPYPILLRRGQDPRLIVSEGPLVGACEKPRFEVAELRLEEGDTVLFYSDGLENLWDSRLVKDCESSMVGSTWLRELVEGSFQQAWVSLRDRAERVASHGTEMDDITVLALRRGD